VKHRIESLMLKTDQVVFRCADFNDFQNVGKISKLLGCICQKREAKNSKWSQIPLPFAKWIIVVQTKPILCAGREDEGHHLRRMS